MQNRRKFLKQAGIGGSMLFAGCFPFSSIAKAASKKLTILHTNDVHSRLEPFGKDSKYEGMGGIAQRATIIEEIRAKESNVLLLDAGDIFQGTPYFNLYKGEPEIKAMSFLQYDACTIGNHDFDAGAENFATQLHHANFPVVISNYDFTGSPLEGKTKPYIVLKRGGIKIGIYGLGIELKGLVADELYGSIAYKDPIQTAKVYSTYLRKEKSCDMVICLSHLGYDYDSEKVCDKIIAKESEFTDLIIGGHTHTFLGQPDVVKHNDERQTFINQAGWGGIKLGRLDFEFYSKKSSNLLNAQSVIVGKQTIG